MPTINDIQEELKKLTNPNNGKVYKNIATWFVEESAYWYDHPNGPVAAPGHASRIEEGPHGYQVPFGAKKFLVENAIKVCIAVASRELVNCGERPDLSRLRAALEAVVPRCVADFEDKRFDRYNVDAQGHMHFGVQSISVSDFVNFFLRQVEFIT